MKVEMIGHNHNRLYCTLTQLHVAGKRMHEVIRDNLKDTQSEEIQAPSDKAVVPSIGTNSILPFILPDSISTENLET